MTALRDKDFRLNLRERRRDEVFVPRPCVGDHRRLVHVALEDTCAKHAKTLWELSKV